MNIKLDSEISCHFTLTIVISSLFYVGGWRGGDSGGDRRDGGGDGSREKIEEKR